MPCSLEYDDELSRVRIDASGLCVTGSGLIDTFSRTVVSGWGTSSDGHTYTLAPTNSEYSVTGGVGRVSMGSVNVFYDASIDRGIADADVTATWSSSKLAVGAPLVIELATRRSDIMNLYAFRVNALTNQSITLDLRKRVANVQTVIASDATVVITHVANTQYKMRFQVIGTQLRCKFWLAASSEPTTWNITATDGALTTGTQVALRSVLSTSTSNAPNVISWDNFLEPTPASAIVDRTTDGINYTTVRGASTVGITTGCALERIVDDYEFPIDELITYRVRSMTSDGITVRSTTCQIQVTLDDVWFKSIGRPFLNQQIFCVMNPSPITRTARNGIFPIVGRSFPVAVTDLRMSRQVSLQVVTQTLQQRQDLDLLLASGDPIFVQTPIGHPLPTMYAVVGDTAEERPVRNRNCDQDWRLWTLPLVEVAAPGPDVVGSTSTWQTVVNTYATWSDVVANNATWADLLELIGDPSEVIVP